MKGRLIIVIYSVGYVCLSSLSLSLSVRFSSQLWQMPSKLLITCTCTCSWFSLWTIVSSPSVTSLLSVQCPLIHAIDKVAGTQGALYRNSGSRRFDVARRSGVVKPLRTHLKLPLSLSLSLSLGNSLVQLIFHTP